MITSFQIKVNLTVAIHRNVTRITYMVNPKARF